MTDAVLRSTEGRIGILTVNNPPVNALAAAVRNGIKEGVEAFGQDPNIDAIVLIGGGRTFIAGADIREFGKPPSGANLNDVIATMENCPKIVVAALHGTPLGGGLETALGAHYRVSLPTTRVGLPEVHLGILPGAGGTQRLPRLTGAKYALDAIISGRHIPAPEAKSKGIIDAIVEGDLLKGAVAHAQMLVAQNAPRRRVRDLTATLESPDLFEETEKAIARRARGFKAPWSIIKCVQAAVELPFDEGMKRERELFVELLTSSGVGGAALLLLRRARGGQGARRAGRHAAARDQDGRHHRRRHHGRRHRHELRQCRHPRDAARGEAGGARPRPEDHPHQLREHRQARRHEGRGRRQAHGADHADAVLRRSQGRRRHHRGGVRDHGSEGRRLQASSTRSPSRARCWRPTPRA